MWYIQYPEQRKLTPREICRHHSDLVADGKYSPTIDVPTMVADLNDEGKVTIIWTEGEAHEN